MARKMKNKLGQAVSVNAPTMPMPTIDKDREMKYRAEDALRDIERAETHRRDGELMKHVKKLAKDKVKSLDKICG